MPRKGQINLAIRDENGVVIPWKKRNREQANAAARKNRRKHPEKLRADRARWMLKSKYGLTPELKQALIAAQDHKCGICSLPIGMECATDHCHKGNFVRGMLCDNCNLGLGNFKDSLELLIKAVEYLQGAETITNIPTISDLMQAQECLEKVKHETQSIVI